jgi:HK97 gp10 family phage protein
VSGEVRLDDRAIAGLFTSPEGPAAKGVLRAAVQVEARAKRLAPVDTGRLRASITHALFRDDQGLLAKVGSDVEYALWQEVGTTTMRGRPYLRPAVAEVLRRLNRG